MKFEIFLDQMPSFEVLLKCYESAVLGLYPKCVSDSVHVNIHVNKSEQMKLSQKSLSAIQKFFLF